MTRGGQGASRGAREAVLYAKRGGVGVVSLNRPQVLNAYNVAMRDALFAALEAVRDDPEVRVMVLRGNGKAFSTGGDVSEFGTAPSPLRAREVRWGRDVWGTLKALPKPTIAAVHGWAVGGGWEMAMLCDLCIASDDASFALPETGLGMIPGVAGTQTIPKLLGQGRGMDYVLTGRTLSAREALALGMLTEVVPRAHLDRAALALAKRLARIDPHLLAASKRAVHTGLDLPLQAAMQLERRLTLEFSAHM